MEFLQAILPMRPDTLITKLDFGHSRTKEVGCARHQSAQREVIEMRTLPEGMIRGLLPFAPLFSKSVWGHVQVLIVGAILAPGKGPWPQPCEQ